MKSHKKNVSQKLTIGKVGLLALIIVVTSFGLKLLLTEYFSKAQPEPNDNISADHKTYTKEQKSVVIAEYNDATYSLSWLEVPESAINSDDFNEVYEENYSEPVTLTKEKNGSIEVVSVLELTRKGGRFSPVCENVEIYNNPFYEDSYNEYVKLCLSTQLPNIVISQSAGDTSAMYIYTIHLEEGTITNNF